MVENADILVNLQGVDNVSPTAQQIAQSMGGATQQTGGLRDSMSQLGNIFSGLNGLVMGVFGAYGLSTFKNMTYGMATAREEVKGLYESVAGTKDDANQLWEYMDQLTNQGYVQLDDLTQAMNVFGMSTGSGVEGMAMAVDMVNDIGNRAIQMGYDSNRQQLLMQSVAQGLNGNLRMLNVAFGITKDKLTNLGWSGASTDIQGYIDALDKYLNKNVKMENLLNSTQGRVVSLQKRFRIAGRNLGNYMLPPINAIMDAFTQLNAQSNDFLASIIIIGTGAMSGFASILPTLSPLIQVYEFLEKNETLKKFSIDLKVGNKIISQSTNHTKSLTSSLASTSSALKEYIGIPVTNWLKGVVSGHTQWIRTPINTFLNNLNLRLGAVNTRLTSFAVGTKATVLTPFNTALGRMRNLLGDVTKRLAGFILQYGKLSTAQNMVPKIMEKGLSIQDLVKDPERAKKLRPAEAMFKNKLFVKDRDSKRDLQKTEAMTKAYMKQTKALSTHTMMMQANNIAQGEGILVSEGLAVANTEEALSEDLSTFAKVKNTIATWANTAGEEAGIWAKMKAIAINLKDVAVKKIVAVWNSIIAITNIEILLPILLIIGAIVALIAIINKIGKSLGWWNNWKEALEAIINGLKRLWSAFINNPNVQGFIKDIQWLFGQLGKGISWVATQILHLFGIEDNGEQVDAVRMIIDVFGALGKILGDIVNIFKRVFGAIYTVISPIVGAIVWVLHSIICILLGCSPGIVPALRKVGDVFNIIFGRIVSFITNPVGFIVGQFKQLVDGAMQIGDIIGNFLIDRFNKFLDFLGPLGTAIKDVFKGALPILANIVRVVSSTIGEVFSIFGGMLSGKIGVEEGLNRLTKIILPLLTRIWKIFVGIFTRIKNFIIKSARSMVNGFIGFILTIPQKLMQIFTGMLNNLFNLPQQIYNAGRQLGEGIYNGVDAKVSELTGGLVHLPGANQKKNAQANAKTMGNVNKNYNNTSKNRTGHVFNIGEGAIKLDARNLTTKESKQVMINALEGLTTYETVHTKNSATR